MAWVYGGIYPILDYCDVNHIDFTAQWYILSFEKHIE